VALGKPLDVRELARLHGPVRGQSDEEVTGGLKPAGPTRLVPADHQPGPAAGQFFQQKAPPASLPRWRRLGLCNPTGIWTGRAAPQR